METGIAVLDERIIPWIVDWAPDVLIALLVFFVGKWIASWLVRLLQRLMVRSHLEQTLVRFLSNLTYTALLAACALAAVDTLGVDITSLLAILGAAGLAVGLALKDSLSNFAAGVMIIVFRPFKIGDFITAAGQSGSVEEIGMFCTLMNSPDNQRIIVPNSSVINGTIINSNLLATRRIDLFFSISFDDSIGDAKKAIEKIVNGDERILKQPATQIGVERIAEKSVDLFVRSWVKTSQYGDVRADMLEKIKVEFDEVGIKIPFRQPIMFMQQEAQKAAEQSAREEAPKEAL